MSNPPPLPLRLSAADARFYTGQPVAVRRPSDYGVSPDLWSLAISWTVDIQVSWGWERHVFAWQPEMMDLIDLPTRVAGLVGGILPVLTYPGRSGNYICHPGWLRAVAVACRCPFRDLLAFGCHCGGFRSELAVAEREPWWHWWSPRY